MSPKRLTAKRIRNCCFRFGSDRVSTTSRSSTTRSLRLMARRERCSRSTTTLAASDEYDIADFEQGQRDYGKYEGETLGLTLSTEPMIQWYRTDIYEELGLAPATTWDEYLANAKAIQEAGRGDGHIMGWGPNASWWWMTLVWSFGGHLYDADLNPMVNSPEAVAATAFFRDLLAYGPEGGISASGDDTTNKFLSQDIGAMIQYSGYWGVALDPANSAFVGKLGTAAMPMGAVDITHLAGMEHRHSGGCAESGRRMEVPRVRARKVERRRLSPGRRRRDRTHVHRQQRRAPGAASLSSASQHPRFESHRALSPRFACGPRSRRRSSMPCRRCSMARWRFSRRSMR